MIGSIRFGENYTLIAHGSSKSAKTPPEVIRDMAEAHRRRGEKMMAFEMPRGRWNIHTGSDCRQEGVHVYTRRQAARFLTQA